MIKYSEQHFEKACQNDPDWYRHEYPQYRDEAWKLQQQVWNYMQIRATSDEVNHVWEQHCHNEYKENFLVVPDNPMVVIMVFKDYMDKFMPL